MVAVAITPNTRMYSKTRNQAIESNKHEKEEDTPPPLKHKAATEKRKHEHANVPQPKRVSPRIKTLKEETPQNEESTAPPLKQKSERGATKKQKITERKVQSPLDAITESFVINKTHLDLSVNEPQWLGEKYLVGRQEELQIIRCSIQNAPDTGTGEGLFLCGAAGTGKSAAIHQVLDDIENDNNAISITCLNGNVFTQPEEILSTLWHEIRVKNAIAPAKEAETTQEEQLAHVTFEVARDELRRCFTGGASGRGKRRTQVVIVDEVDRLLDAGGQHVLYELFEWPRLPGSDLVLIGIANAVDLNHRFLPHLKARNCVPHLLVFPAYDCTKLSLILKYTLVRRLQGENTLFLCSAIDYIAKTLVQTGDARKAIDVCHRAIDIARNQSTAQQAPQHKLIVGMPHVIKALAKVMVSPNVRMISDLPQHAKVALCAFVRFHKKRGKVTASQVYTIYAKLARDAHLPLVTWSVFTNEILDTLSHSSLIDIKCATGRKLTDLRARVVRLTAAVREIKIAFRDSSVLLGLLPNDDVA
jgi:Cdc6-like AAA superfamily ATPase